jgi:hypothetical protein
MAKIKLEGVAPHYDGEYQLDLSYFTNREFQRMKELSGIRPAELMEAVLYRDAGVIVAVAEIALRRDGHEGIETALLWDAPAGKIVLDFTSDEPEGDDEPSPSVAPEDSSSDDVESSPSEKSESSGADSSSGGDPPASDRSGIGAPG